MTEEWRPIAGFPGYEVSDEGRVRSWRPIGRCGTSPEEPRVLKQHPNRGGYPKVQLGLYGGTHTVHRLVALAFLGEPPDGCEVAHGNGVRSDNRVSNLRWASRRENHLDKRRHGSYGRTVTQEIADEVRRLYRPGEITQRELGSRFGITQATVSKLVRNQSWKESTT